MSFFKRMFGAGEDSTPRENEKIQVTEAEQPVDDGNDNPVIEAIRRETTESPVVLFMKGTPVFPQCGFSSQVVGVLSHLGVKFKGIDVLMDPELREGIKAYSNWPTIPQLYVKGEFVGGCDIVREMFEADELVDFLQSKGIECAMPEAAD